MTTSPSDTPTIDLDDFRVRLDAFEGPLDLLLFLIRKSEVDIHDIPIATIARQYLDILERVGVLRGRIDIDAAGEFLVMAATLTEIKSRMLLPRPDDAPSDTTHAKPREDPRAELVKQLLEYKKFRDAADDLDRRAAERRSKFFAGPAGIDGEALQRMIASQADLELEDLELIDLVSAFQKISETVNFDRLGDHQVTYDDTPIELHAQDILSRLAEFAAVAQSTGAAPRPHAMEFREIFRGRTRGEAVGLFLALLELIRNRKVRVRQERVEGAILVEPRSEDLPAHTEHHEAAQAAPSDAKEHA